MDTRKAGEGYPFTSLEHCNIEEYRLAVAWLKRVFKPRVCTSWQYTWVAGRYHNLWQQAMGWSAEFQASVIALSYERPVLHAQAEC